MTNSSQVVVVDGGVHSSTFVAQAEVVEAGWPHTAVVSMKDAEQEPEQQIPDLLKWSMHG